MLKPEDFATREEALAYANTKLDEWQEKFKALEHDMVFLSESPTPQEVTVVANKWVLEAQEATSR